MNYERYKRTEMLLLFYLSSPTVKCVLFIITRILICYKSNIMINKITKKECNDLLSIYSITPNTVWRQGGGEFTGYLIATVKQG